jgi:hypothetical protein
MTALQTCEGFRRFFQESWNTVAARKDGWAMGFYDYRCMVTGVSLKGAATALVLLEELDRSHRPIALAITGNYNRLGSIDGIEEDGNTDLVFAYLRAKHQSGEMVVDPAELEYRGMDDLEALLALIERNVTESPNSVLLGGRRIFYALICQEVWKAVVCAHQPKEESASDLFARLFKGVPIAEDIYKGQLTGVKRHLQDLAAVSDFLTSHGLTWKRPNPGNEGEVSQHYGEEMRQYLEEAKLAFHDCPTMLQGIEAARAEAGDLLEDD